MSYRTERDEDNVSDDETREPTVIDTPDGIEMYRRLAIVHGLALKVNTGISPARNFRPRDLVASVLPKGTTIPRTHKAQLRVLVDHMRQEFGYEPSRSVTRALTS